MNSFKSINVQTLKTKLDCNEDFVLIDVRENQELGICKLDKAIHIPMKSIPVYLNQIDFKKPAVPLIRPPPPTDIMITSKPSHWDSISAPIVP